MWSEGSMVFRGLSEDAKDDNKGFNQFLVINTCDVHARLQIFENLSTDQDTVSKSNSNFFVVAQIIKILIDLGDEIP